MTYIGIDISKKTFDTAVFAADGAVLRRKFQNQLSGFCDFLQWVQLRVAGPITLAMEATGTYGQELARVCFDAGWQVQVINPARIKAYATAIGQKNKTDRADAQTIGRFAQRTPELKAWVPLSPAQAQLRALVRERLHVQDALQAERTRLLTSAPCVRAQGQQRIELLERQHKALLRSIQQLIRGESVLERACQLLQSIRGIGFWTAAVLLGELPPIHPGTKTRQIVSLFGLCPRYAQSGTSVCKPLGRWGRWLLGRQLYMPAMVALRHNPLMMAFAQRLKARGKFPKQIITAVRHRLLRLAVGVLKTGQPFNLEFRPIV